MEYTALQIAPPYFSLVFLISVVFVALPVAALVGWLLGRRSFLSLGYDKSPPSSISGEDTSNAILALLGLLLAFTFGFSLSHAEKRKVAQLEEATAISTAFVRADLLEEPGRSALREKIGLYAETRVIDNNVLASADTMGSYLQQTLKAQEELWPAALNAITPGTPPAVAVLITSGMTDVLDAHTRRLAAGVDAIPVAAKSVLLLYAALVAFLAGNNSALRGRGLSWRTFVLSVTLSMVICVVLDFERTREGFIRVSPTIMQVTSAEINAALAAE